MPGDLEAKFAERDAFSLDVCDYIPKTVDVEDVAYQVSAFCNLWLRDGKDVNRADGLAEFLKGYTKGDMGNYWSEYVAAVKGRANRMVPEYWIGNLECQQARRQSFGLCLGMIPYWRSVIENVA